MVQKNYPSYSIHLKFKHNRFEPSVWQLVLLPYKDDSRVIMEDRTVSAGFCFKNLSFDCLQGRQT